MSNSENERTRRQSDAKLISGGARKSPTDQLIITGKQYDDLHAEMQIVLFLRQIGDLRSAITSGQLADKTITEIVSKRDLPQAIKPAITSIAQELYEIYKQAPQNLSPFDFMSEYIAEDIAPTIYDQIETRDPLQEGLVFHRGVIPAFMLLIAYDQIRTHGNEEDKFYRRQWDTLFDKLEKSVYPVKDSTILHDFYTSIQQSVQLLGYQPERQ